MRASAPSVVLAVGFVFGHHYLKFQRRFFLESVADILDKERKRMSGWAAAEVGLQSRCKRFRLYLLCRFLVDIADEETGNALRGKWRW